MPILFSFPNNEILAEKILSHLDISKTSLGNLSIKKFPDGESLVTIHTDVKNKKLGSRQLRSS